MTRGTSWHPAALAGAPSISLDRPHGGRQDVGMFPGLVFRLFFACHGLPTTRGTFHLMLLVLAVIAGCAGGCGDSSTLYTVDWDVSGYNHVDVLVNGVPAYTFDSRTNAQSGFASINWFLRDGSNDIRVVVAGPNGSQQAAVVRVCKRPDDAPYQDATPIKEFRFGKGGPSEGEGALTLEAHLCSPGWSWQSAEKIAALSPEDRGQIIDRIKAWHAALANRDAEAEASLLKEGMVEVARSLYMDAADMQRELRESHEGVFSAGSWSVKDLDVDSLRLVVYGSIVIVDRDGGPVLEWRIADSGKRGGSGFTPGRIIVKRAAFVKTGGRWVLYPIM